MTLRESSSSPSPMGDRYRSTLFFATADTYGRDMYLVWAALRKDHARIPVTIVKMAKGKRNSLKKKKQQKGTDEVQNGKEDDDDKTCPHISKSVKLNCLQNKVPHTSLGQCLNCGQLDGSERFGVCICLFCAHQGCDRNSEDKHALSHNKENPLHNIVVSLQTWVVWCYACDDEVLVEPDSSVQKCIKLLLKAMNLTPPAELEASLSSQDKVSTEKPKKDGSKANNQLKSQIKGLANLGNTCFFNSVMQNLCQTELLYVAASCATQEGFSYHVTPNKKDLQKLKLKVEEAPGEVTKALWKLLQDFRTSTDRTLTPRQLFAEICKKATRFKGYRQQDSQELLRYLLDSVRNEELRRVKLAVLHSFGVKGDGDAKTLDDSKRVQVREYGASAAAPLIDSVFAGRLVSIVTCHQCHQEFKVEETFLDLSLPLASPPQESFSNKFFGKGGKQNPKSSNTPKNVSKNEKEDEKQKETKSLSKHQLKSAKKAERKKKKGGKGHGKKGKASQQVDDNKQDDDDELDRRASEEEGHELDQMNVSDLEGSDNDHEIKVNETEVLGNSNSGCEMIPDNDIQLRDNDSSSKSAEVSEKDVDTCILDSNDDEYLAENTVDCADSEQAEGVKDSEEQRAMQTEQSTEHLNGGTSRNGSTNDNEENKSSSMEILNCNQVTASKQPSCDSLRCSQEKGTEKVDHYQQGYEEIPSSIKEFLKEIINLAVDLNKGKPSELQDDIVNPSGSFSPSCVSSGEKQGKETAHDLQEKLDGDEVDRKSTKIVLSLGVEHDCAQTEQETNITENQRLCSNSGKGDENEGATEISAKSEEESETESEEEFENDNGIDRILTVQPAYRPSPGECSVLSCLSQFCVSELLDGNNKFACEVCTKRAQRNNKEEGSRKTKDNDKDDVSGDSSSEDEPKGAKAQKSSKNKNKDSQQQTVYTVASKQMLISLAPPVLTLHLKRFQQARFTLQKLTKHVDFPLELNLAPFCSRSGRSRADSEGKVLYSLYGVIQHSGNMNSGHYTAYVKVSEPPMKSLYDKITSMSELTDFIEKMWTQKSEAQHGSSRTHHEPAPSGQWFHVSDSSVSAAAESKVLKSQAYMLFYGRLPLVSG